MRPLIILSIMMFHASMLITLIGGLLGIAWLRRRLGQWPRLSEARLDLVIVILLFFVVVASEVDHYNSGKELDAEKAKVGDTGQKLRAANKEIDALKKQIRDVDNWGPSDEQWKVVTANLQTEAVVSPPPSEEQEPFISCIMGDAQSSHFAARLAQAFRDAGWKIKGAGYRQIISEPVPDGVKFHVHSRSENIPVLEGLIGTLEFFRN